VKYKILYIFLIFLGLFGLVYIYFNNPAETPFVPCYFHELTGLECPGCGITRAIYCLMHFDIVQALHYNVMFVLTIPLLMFCGLKKIQDSEFEIKLKPLLIYVAVLLIFAVARNFSSIF